MENMKASNLIKALFAIAYFVGGVLLLIGVITPYPDFPLETDILTVDSEVERNSEGRYLFKLGIAQSPLCDKMWVPKEKIIDFLNQNDVKFVKIGIEKTAKNKAKKQPCLKLFSLTINNQNFFTYKDAATSREYIELFFSIVALILILASFVEARKLTRIISGKQKKHPSK